MKKRSGVLFFFLLAAAIVCYAGVTYTSFNNKTGTWEAAGTWSGSKPSNTNLTSDDIININGYVTRNGSYTIDGNGTLKIYDTLVITTNLTISQLSPTTGVQVMNGGLLIVLGNFSTSNSNGNMVNVNAGGRFVVIGNYDQQQGSVNATGAFYIFDNTPTFNWGSTVDGTGYNNNTGTLTGLLDDETDLVANDKPLVAFLQNLGVGTIACNATPNYITASGAGNWTTAGAWSASLKPSYTLTSGAYTIPASNIVTIESGNFSVTGADIIVYGTLIINGTLNLDAGKKINVKVGGSVTCCSNCNTSNKIKIGGATVWTGSDGTVNGPKVISAAGILPIKLMYFKVNEVTSEGIDIQWATSYEENFDYFLLERAGDDLNFQTIATIGNTGGLDVVAHYSYLDNTPLNGKNYYRLKSIDFDWSFEYSNIIFAQWNLAKEKSEVTIYPNPIVNHTFTLEVNHEIKSNASVTLLNSMGKEITQYAIQSNKQIISLSDDLKPGAYYLKITGSDFSKTIKVFIQ